MDGQHDAAEKAPPPCRAVVTVHGRRVAEVERDRPTIEAGGGGLPEAEVVGGREASPNG
jgi:hypothetical protein